MTTPQLTDRILTYINRATGALQSSVLSRDMVLDAINDARRKAQRDHNFQMLRGEAFITTDANGVDYLTGCKTTPAGSTTQLMKLIDSVWQYSTSGAFYTRTVKVDFGTVRQFNRELPMLTSLGVVYSPSNYTTPLFAFLKGTKLAFNSSTSSTFLVDGIKWLDDVAPDDTTDIFVTYFSDWLLWASLLTLNVHLKEDQRVTISNSLLSAAWDSVREFDGNIANSGDASSLD